MVTKRTRKPAKRVASLTSKGLSAKQAKEVKGGIIAVLRKEATINWGDGMAPSSALKNEGKI